MDLTSGQLVLMRAVQEHGSLARAAQALEITAPAVSQQIARLEREIGAPVVERGARGTQLTGLGRLLAAHAARVADELEQAKESVAGYLGTHAHRLRIGAFPSAAVALLPEALTALRYRHLEAELSVSELPSDAGPELVAAGELDVAVTASYGQKLTCEADVRLEHLHTDPIYVVLPDDHRLARGPDDEAVPISELVRDAWACGVAGRPARNQVEAAAAQFGVTVRVPFQTESYDVAQALAGSGIAVAFVPELALVRAKSTRTRRLFPALHRDIYVAMPSTTGHVALVPELLELLRQSTAHDHPVSARASLVR
jgi:DNA-binding transcriptional LysR family regulator